VDIIELTQISVYTAKADGLSHSFYLQYLEQFDELYEDFNLVKLPLLEEEVRGVDALKAFSTNLIKGYEPPPPRQAGSSAREAELEAQVQALSLRVKELEAQLAR